MGALVDTTRVVLITVATLVVVGCTQADPPAVSIRLAGDGGSIQIPGDAEPRSLVFNLDNETDTPFQLRAVELPEEVWRDIQQQPIDYQQVLEHGTQVAGDLAGKALPVNSNPDAIGVFAYNQNTGIATPLFWFGDALDMLGETRGTPPENMYVFPIPGDLLFPPSS